MNVFIVFQTVNQHCWSVCIFLCHSNFQTITIFNNYGTFYAFTATSLMWWNVNGPTQFLLLLITINVWFHTNTPVRKCGVLASKSKFDLYLYINLIHQETWCCPIWLYISLSVSSKQLDIFCVHPDLIVVIKILMYHKKSLKASDQLESNNQQVNFDQMSWRIVNYFN